MPASFLTETDNEKGPTGGFKVVFPDGADLSDVDRKKLAELAHREFFRLLMGKDAKSDATLAKMRTEIESSRHGRQNIRLEVFLVDENNRATSFASGLWKIGKFLPASKDLFIKHAIETLGQVGSVSHERGSQEGKDAYRLCCALLKAKEHWGDNEAAFEALKDNAALGKLIYNATNSVEKDTDKSTARYSYRGLNEREHGGRSMVD